MRKHWLSNKMRSLSVMSALTCFALSAPSRRAECTTHFVFYDGGTVWIGSDGLRLVSGGRPSIPVCKLLGNSELVLLSWGELGIRTDLVGGPGTDTELFSFHDLAAKIMNARGTVQAKESKLESLSTQNLTDLMNFSDPHHTIKDFRGLSMGWLLLWFEDGILMRRQVDFIVPEANSRKIQTLRGDSTPFRIHSFQEFPETLITPPHSDAAEDADVGLYIQHLLQLASENPNAAVGKPFAVAKFTPGHLEWVEGGERCKTEMSRKAE